jgi:superoxide dismutase, Fe-Mn family
MVAPAPVGREVRGSLSVTMDHPLTTDRRQFLACSGLGAFSAYSALSLDGGPNGTPAPDAGEPGVHELPKLPYAYDALAPHVDAQTMRLHHQKHHGGALKGLNRTEVAIVNAAKVGDFTKTRQLCRAIAYYGSSHILHSIFWTNMKAGGGGDPKGDLAKRLKSEFGSIKNFKGMFLAAANTAPASGWGMLGYHRELDRMLVLQVADHENLTLWGVVPLLVCDVWEHAYYLKYQNRRKDWTSTFVKSLVDWDDVAKRFAAAR